MASEAGTGGSAGCGDSRRWRLGDGELGRLCSGVGLPIRFRFRDEKEGWESAITLGGVSHESDCVRRRGVCDVALEAAVGAVLGLVLFGVRPTRTRGE